MHLRSVLSHFASSPPGRERNSAVQGGALWDLSFDSRGLHVLLQAVRGTLISLGSDPPGGRECLSDLQILSLQWGGVTIGAGRLEHQKCKFQLAWHCLAGLCVLGVDTEAHALSSRMICSSPISKVL